MNLHPELDAVLCVFLGVWGVGVTGPRVPHLALHLGLGLGLGLGICLCLTAFTMTSMVRDRGKCTGRRLSSIKPSELWIALLGFSSSSHNRESTLFGVQVRPWD